MRDPREVIIRPILTEKAVRLRDSQNVYTFEVARDATKPMIKQAVQQLWGVEVEWVRTLNVKPKPRRNWRGRTPGWTRRWKKAYVKLKEGHSIPELAGGA